MAFKRPPYLMREKTRHGIVVWYLRRGDGPRTRIRGEYGSAEFMANYNAALAGSKPLAKDRKEPTSESLAWLVARYRESNAWTSLSYGTRRAREYNLREMESVDIAYKSITSGDLFASMEKRSHKPNMANHFLKSVRGLFKWAKKAQLVDVDPSRDLEKVPVPETDGYHTWTDQEIAAFERRWPVGTRERLAFAIMLHTGLRRGDAVRLGKQHIRRGVVSIATEKTGAEVNIPLAPELAATIKATKTGDLVLVAKENGQPMSKARFGRFFADACKAAGVVGRAHGVRKAKATHLAEAGNTLPELNAIFGWTGTQMAMRYTEAADRKKLAITGMAKASRRNKK